MNEPAMDKLEQRLDFYTARNGMIRLLFVPASNLGGQVRFLTLR